MIVSAILTNRSPTCPKRRREGCPIANEEASNFQKVLMQNLTAQQDLFGEYDKPLSFNRKVYVFPKGDFDH
jgi:hypothetical protein